MSPPRPRITRAAVALLLAHVAFGCDADTDPGETGGSGFVDELNQPLGGLMFAALKIDGTTAVHYAMRGDAHAESLVVSPEAVSDGSGVAPPSIAGVGAGEVDPMRRIVVHTEHVRTQDVAVSVLFDADGAVPVAVPAIAVTPTSVEVAVPPLIDASGNSVAGRARLRIWQYSSDGFAASAFYDGVHVRELPAHPGGTPGVIYAAFTEAALLDIAELRDDLSADLPPSYATALADLQNNLGKLVEVTDQAIADPASPPGLVWTGSEPPLLTTDALLLADRLCLAIIASVVDEFESADTSGAKSRHGVIERATTSCPRQVGLPELDDQICDLRRGGRVSDLGSRLLALGARFYMSVYLGFVGGAGAAVMSAQSAEAEVAFEMTWAAATGHVASWATGSPPPSEAQTQAAVGVVLLDRMAGRHGVLGALHSVMSFGRELDDVVEQWRSAHAIPGGDDAPDAGDAGPDAALPDSGPGSGVYEGMLVDSVDDYISGDCTYRATLTCYVTVAGFGGAGTPANPYLGEVDLFGELAMTPLTAGADCQSGTIQIPPTESVVTGSAGVVEFVAIGSIGSELVYTFADGEVSPGEIDGWLTVDMITQGRLNVSFNGALLLTRQ